MVESIVEVNVTCNDQEQLELDVAVVTLDKRIVRTEAVLEDLQVALDDATNTRTVPVIGQMASHDH